MTFTDGALTIKTSEDAVQMLAGLAYCGYYIMHRKHIEEGKDALTTKYIGTGPFAMGDETPNVVRKMNAVKDWWWGKDQWGNQLPYLDGIVHKQFGDREGIKAAFRTGAGSRSLDYIRNASDADFGELLGDVDAWGSVIVGNCHSCANFIALSHETIVNGEPFFANVDARRAVSMAINRQAIKDDLYGGAANDKTWIGSGWLGKLWPPPYSEQGEWMKFDPVAAKNLLAQFGVSPETPIDMDYRTVAAEPVVGLGSIQGPAVLALDTYLANLKEVGINLNFITLEPRGLNPIIYGEAGWTGMANGTVSGAGLDADVIIQSAVTGSGTNWTRAGDSKIDDLWRKTRSETDNDKRTDLNNEIEEYVNQDQQFLGPQIPNPFGYSTWRKYMHNLIDPSSMWISGGMRVDSARWWQDASAPKRNIDDL
jgi:ABC-type transport system substrate-binding protein